MNILIHNKALAEVIFRLCFPVLLVLGIVACPCPARQKPKQPVILTGILPPQRSSEQTSWWEAIRKNGKVHGFAHSIRIPYKNDAKNLYKTVRETEVDKIVLRRKTKELVSIECVETESGLLQSFRYRLSLDDRIQQEVHGHRVGETLELVWTANKVDKKKIVNLPPETRSEFFPLRDIQQRPFERNESRRYRIFKVESHKVVTERWQADRPRTVKLPDGSRRKLFKVRVSDSENPSLTRYVYLDSWGNVAFSKITHRDRTVFTTLRIGEKRVESLMLASIERRLKPVIFLEPLKWKKNQKQAFYRLTNVGISFPVELPVSKTQRVLKVDEKSRDVEIGLTVLRDFQQVGLRKPTIPPPSAFLDHKHRAILDLTRRVVLPGTESANAAFLMEKYVFRNMKLKPFSPQMDPASQVAKTLQGDSTEYATLLATMLRAYRIPSRVAFGLRYSPRKNAFVVHFWTEAWLRGTWYPLDATRGEGGIYLDYIKLGDTLLDDSVKPIDLYRPFLKLLPELQIQVIEKNKERQ